jgi:hypothetical protein
VLVVLLLGGGFWLLAKGILVPGSALNERERLIEYAWKAHDREHARCELLEKQLDESMELSRTSAHVLTAVAAAAGVEATEGDGENAPSSAVA